MENEFLNLSTKFLFINGDSGVSERKTSELNRLLNDLSCLDYKYQNITETKLAVQLLQSFCNISSSEDTLIVKACWLIKTLVAKQQIVVQGRTLESLISWIITCIKHSFYSILCDALDGLAVLLRMDASVIPKFYEELISTDGLLIQLLNNPYYRKPDESYETNAQEEILLSSLACLESILSAWDADSESSQDYLTIIGNTVLKLAYKIDGDKLGEKLFYTIVTTVLSSLRYCCEYDQEWNVEHLGELLGLAKSLMMVGLPDIQYKKPQKLMKAQQGVPEPRQIPTNRGGKMAKTRKPRASNKPKSNEKKKLIAGDKKGQEEALQLKMPYSDSSIVLEFDQQSAQAPPYRTSESDFSESEANRIKVDRQRQSKLRQTALTLICTMAQTVDKRQMFGYWHSIFPYEQVTPTTASLLTCICRDPSTRCRMVAVQATSFMLYKSKPYLVQAETEKVASSFTPFSVALGNMICNMYESLTHALANEGDGSVLTQILKCLSVFIQATPFHHLRTGIVTKFVRYVRKLVWNKDPTVKVGALMVMGYLLSVDVMTPEILECIGCSTAVKAENISPQRTEEDDEEIIESEDEEEQAVEAVVTAIGSKLSISWLLQTALEHLGVQVSPYMKPAQLVVNPLRIECLQVLFAMSSHFHLLQQHLPFVAEALSKSFNDPSFDIKLYAGRVLDVLGHTMGNYLLDHKNDRKPDDVNVCLKFWLDLFPVVKQVLQNNGNSAALRMICCDALGNIGVEVFERLPHDRNMLLISLLSGCACDEDVCVRASAIRASAVFVMFPSLRDDMCYIENTTESILRLMKDTNILARIKASWSLGNITDALIMNAAVGAIGRNLLKRVFEMNIEAAADSDKVKSNVMRSLGNCLRLITDDLVQSAVFNQLAYQAIEKLVHNVTTGNNVKVKWNACYAIGNFMKNPVLFSDSFRNKWQDLVFPALCKIIVLSPNFKVRTNAAAAMIVLGIRTEYGPHFNSIWSAMLAALEASDNLHDFNEYNHRDNLQEQLCVALSHLIELATIDDLVAMYNLLLPSLDITKQNWQRVTNTNRLLPEKSARMLSACKRLTEAENLAGNDKSKQKAIASMLLCFGNLNE